MKKYIKANAGSGRYKIIINNDGGQADSQYSMIGRFWGLTKLLGEAVCKEPIAFDTFYNIPQNAHYRNSWSDCKDIIITESGDFCNFCIRPGAPFMLKPASDSNSRGDAIDIFVPGCEYCVATLSPRDMKKYSIAFSTTPLGEQVCTYIPSNERLTVMNLWSTYKQLLNENKI